MNDTDGATGTPPLIEFWNVVVDVWQDGLYGVDIGQTFVALGIFLAFLILRRLLSWMLLRHLRKLTSRSERHLDDRIVEALTDPIRFVPVVMGVFFASEFVNASGTLDAFLTNLNRSLIVFNLFWGIFNIVAPLSFMFKKLARIFSESLVDWLTKAIRIGVAFIGLATVLEIWGIEVAPIIAGLGLFGVAVALGAQDLFKNLIAGLLVLGEKRFNPGDWIRVDGVVEGTVERIGFRSTLVRRFDKAPVHVPNAQLSDNPVTNFSAMTHRRIYWKIGVEYRTTVDQLRKIRDEIEQYILNEADFAKPSEVPTFVRIDAFNDSSIDIMLYCFTRTTVWGDWLEIKERLAYRIKEIVEGAGTSFAFPSTSLYVETVPGEQAEPFSPPGDADSPKDSLTNSGQPALERPAETAADPASLEHAKPPARQGSAENQAETGGGEGGGGR